jgi:3-oxoacyl-[acyl-carrier protein] reductase
VVICARSEEDLAKAEADLRAITPNVLSIVSDVTEPATPKQLVGQAVDRFGGLDILVANAGGPPAARALDLTDDAIEKAVNANLITTVRLVREAVPHMRAHRWGRIVAIASNSVKQPIDGLALSNTARTGLWAWAKTAAKDLAEEGITLNLACPGLHNTDRIRSLGVADTTALGDPADFGAVVCFLCSAQAKFVNGTAIAIDGGEVAGLL